ncbi:hypothetical protein DEU56DRAFT_977359 [Suillus clintonianus]|uniref:uncharacterized protein n=1 Tax=Suillus clintonianus TaxID=1904413 RepID=UPI001B85D0A4|nr:uncharacterized protein DEU56DRAFT_977359 [Suillus clintonianus]KAG2151335.1 hypothetical protein DEU56DRAFT_977359 [Suillus clintonianus]
MSASQAPSRVRRRVVQDVPVVRQSGLNIAGRSSTDQLGCPSEIPELINTPELPPLIHPPPIFSHDGYTSTPPTFQHHVPPPRASRFTGTAPRAVGPDRVQRSFAPAKGDIVSRYRMVYTYLPLCGAEKSRQEYTDGVVFRDETTGVQKTTMQWYQLPPVRPPREFVVPDSETTPIATTPRPSTSTIAATGRLIDDTKSKDIVKEAKTAVITESLNRCAFHDSASRMTVVKHVLTYACSLVITDDCLIKQWVNDNLLKLYKSVVTPMSTVLNRFKQSARDVVENLYNLQLSIWTDEMVQIDHAKSTVDFLTGNDSINFIFGDLIRREDGQTHRYPFEHNAIIQIATRAAFRDGYDKFIDSDTSLDNIMALSATAACCTLREFSTD